MPDDERPSLDQASDRGIGRAPFDLWRITECEPQHSGLSGAMRGLRSGMRGIKDAYEPQPGVYPFD